MSYPPPHNGPYPPYLQQQPQHPRQSIQPQQFLYNNINSAQSYQYGKPVAYPQAVLSNFNAYAQALNHQQQHPQQPQPSPQPQPQPRQQQQPRPPEPRAQYVNPADLFQQAPAAPAISPQFNTMGPSQYAGQPAVPITNDNPIHDNASRSPIMPTVSGSTQSSLYRARNSSQPDNNAYGQYPQVAPKPQLAPVQAKPTVTPGPTPTPASPAPIPPSKSSTPSSAPTPFTSHVPVPPVPSTPTAPTSTQRAVPQVLVPAPSPEVQQIMRQTTPKQQLPRQNGQQASRKPGQPPIDYQVLLLSLADDYINAAHSHGTMVALTRGEMDVEEYYRLLSTGLGCLEAVLKVG